MKRKWVTSDRISPPASSPREEKQAGRFALFEKKGSGEREATIYYLLFVFVAGAYVVQTDSRLLYT